MYIYNSFPVSLIFHVHQPKLLGIVPRLLAIEEKHALSFSSCLFRIFLTRVDIVLLLYSVNRQTKEMHGAVDENSCCEWL